MVEKYWNASHHFQRRYADAVDETTFWTVYAEHSLLVEAIRSLDVDEGEGILATHISRIRATLITD
jgi:DNA-binding GntR family transcriptional regulator